MMIREIRAALSRTYPSNPGLPVKLVDFQFDARLRFIQSYDMMTALFRKLFRNRTLQNAVEILLRYYSTLHFCKAVLGRRLET